MEKTAEYYDDNLKEVKLQRASFSATMKARAMIVSNLIKKYSFEKDLLDAGCGTGHMLSEVIKNNSRQFDSIQATDFSKEACKNVSERLQIKTFIADLKNLKSSKKYDSIICSEVIEHVKDDEKVIRNISNILNGGGKVIFTVPFLMKNWSKFDEISGHIRRYEPGELESKLTKHGIEILDSFAWGNFLYKLYFEKVIKNNDPHEKKNSSNFKILLATLLSRLFMVDNLFLRKDKGITLFVVGKKIKNSYI